MTHGYAGVGEGCLGFEDIYWHEEMRLVLEMRLRLRVGL